MPIHPDHLSRIPESLRRQLVFETGYGKPFGISDAQLASQSGGISSRHEILADIGNAIIAKPMQADLGEMREGGVLWGYTHCAQQRAITHAALDHTLTLVAFEIGRASGRERGGPSG